MTQFLCLIKLMRSRFMHAESSLSLCLWLNASQSPVYKREQELSDLARGPADVSDASVQFAQRLNVAAQVEIEIKP